MKILYCSEIRGNVENLKRVRDFFKGDAAILSGNFVDIFNDEGKKNFGVLTKIMLDVRAQNRVNDSLEAIANKIISMDECDKKLRDLAGAYLEISRAANKESIKQYNAIDEVVREFNMPVFIIHGCNDTRNIADYLGDKSLHRSVKDVGGVSFGGYGGSNMIIGGCVNIDNSIGFNEEEAYNDFVKMDPDVAVVYHQPYGFFNIDKEKGSFGLLAYIARENPNVVLVGRGNKPDVLIDGNIRLINAGSLNEDMFMEIELCDKGYFEQGRLYKTDKDNIQLVNSY